MDAIDILGDLLGHKTKQPGRGTDILKDIFGRQSRQSSSTTQKSMSEIQSDAAELEELLNVANDRKSGRRPPSPRSMPVQVTPVPRETSSPGHHDAGIGRNRYSDEDRAVVLIRAMINAAKSDGRIERDEQDRIIKQLGNPSRENVEFLRNEFSAPLDVPEFVRSVPIGMEQQVYTMSLIAIDLNEGSEASYLMQLADGLRIPADVREQIHQRCGAPSVY
jgi:hypothetical protein